MADYKHSIGFTYFSSPKFSIESQVRTWFPALKQFGASKIIFKADFNRAIPEDIFLQAKENDLVPFVIFTSELPLARNFNDLSFLMEAYARWGLRGFILGDKPNSKGAWPTDGWHYANLVDHFLERFIPLANYAVQIGVDPLLSPLQPGGDYWDTAFVELVIKGLKRRRLDEVLDKLILTSYGYTFDKPLSWGNGGPERWSVSKPYLTPEGQQDQLGFHNFEWLQAFSQRVTGKEQPVMILDAGKSGDGLSPVDGDNALETIQRIILSCRGKNPLNEGEIDAYPVLNENVDACIFSMDMFEEILTDTLSVEVLAQIFGGSQEKAAKSTSAGSGKKLFSHYLLLPSHSSGVSDVVLNKVRPLIKRFHPTVGFSLEEAALADKVSVYPDAVLFPDEKLDQLRANGCNVVVLPETGIEIATSLQGS